MDLSANIKAIREAKRVKQLEIATALDIDPSNYAKLEKRGSKLTLEQLEKIAGALGVSVMELITGEAQTVQNDERVKELEILVNHWKELAETRNELLKIKERQLEGYQEIAINELVDVVFLKIQSRYPENSRLPIDVLLKINGSPLDDMIQMLSIDEQRQLYRDSMFSNDILDYAIREGLLGDEGEIFRAYQAEFDKERKEAFKKQQEAGNESLSKPKE